jgi:RNA polymerase sigma-70 factor (ECF subfamily)
MDSPRHQYEADLVIVREFLDNPASASNPLLERLRIVPRILAALNARCGGRLDSHELADLTQDVFLLVLRKLDGFFGNGSLDGWLYRMCEFELLNRLRKRRRGPVLLGELPAEAEPATCDPPEPEGLVAAALQRLGGYEAQIIHLRLEDELDFEAIGERLQITAANAKTRYYRGLARLQSMLARHAPLRHGDPGGDQEGSQEEGRKETQR